MEVSLVDAVVVVVGAVVVDDAGPVVLRAFSKAATVAGSTTPVVGTPSLVWNALSASVSSGVHWPSTGPFQ